MIDPRGWRLWLGTVAGCPILLVQTGMGKERACAAAEAVLQAYPVTLALNFGFGAAATDALAVGDMVLGTGFRSTHPMTANGLLPADPRLIQAALQAGPVPRNVPRSAPLHTGHCLTVDRLVTHSQDKRRLGQAYSVQVIDMESYSLAQAAAQRNIPFLALRVISDDVRQDLPPYDTYLHPDGRLYWPAALRRWITHPGDLLHLLRMAYQTRRAQHKLAVWLPGIIPLISPQP